MARPWPVLVLLLLVPCGAAHSGDDPVAWVPASVVGEHVPFTLEGLVDEVTANLTVAGLSVQVNVTGADAGSGLLKGVGPGLHAWTLNVTDDTVMHTLTGTVFVQHPVAALQAGLDALSAALEGLVADVDAVSNQTAGLNGVAGLSDRLAALEAALAQVDAGLLDIQGQAQDDGTLAELELLRGDVATLSEAVGEVQEGLAARKTPAPTVSLADPVGRAGTWTTLLLVLGLGGFVGFSQWSAQHRRREVMVLLLSLAAKLQVSPDSEEFRSAVEALDA